LGVGLNDRLEGETYNREGRSEKDLYSDLGVPHRPYPEMDHPNLDCHDFFLYELLNEKVVSLAV
jgi:hypothetical protein